jgi:hypothetical protein
MLTETYISKEQQLEQQSDIQLLEDRSEHRSERSALAFVLAIASEHELAFQSELELAFQSELELAVQSGHKLVEP